MKLLIPPPVYLLLTMVGMWLLDRYFPIAEWLGFPWNKIGLGLIGVALIADLIALFYFVKAKTTVNPTKPQNTANLVIKGSYRYSRNPMYLGMVVILIGWGLWLGSLSPLLLIPVFVWITTEWQIKPEEQILLSKFGEAYQHYQQQVRRWL